MKDLLFFELHLKFQLCKLKCLRVTKFSLEPPKSPCATRTWNVNQGKHMQIEENNHTEVITSHQSANN